MKCAHGLRQPEKVCRSLWTCRENFQVVRVRDLRAFPASARAARTFESSLHVERELLHACVRKLRTFPVGVRSVRTFETFCGPKVLTTRAPAGKFSGYVYWPVATYGSSPCAISAQEKPPLPEALDSLVGDDGLPRPAFGGTLVGFGLAPSARNRPLACCDLRFESMRGSRTRKGPHHWEPRSLWWAMTDSRVPPSAERS